MPLKKRSFRIDFIEEVVDINKEERKVTVKLVPDPNRYEKRVLNGKEGYIDKFDGMFFTLDVLAESFNKSCPQPIYWTRPLESNIGGYVASRFQPVSEQLTEPRDPECEIDRCTDMLGQALKPSTRAVVVSIDLIGSTEVLAKLGNTKFSLIFRAMCNELTTLVHIFRGHVLKFTGDGALFFFVEPDFIGHNDCAVGFAVAARDLLVHVFGIAMENQGIVRPQIRIGIDSGDVSVVKLGAAKLKVVADLIGLTISFAKKAEEQAPPQQIIVGQTCADNLHWTWRTMLRPFGEIQVPLEAQPPYSNGYSLYLLRSDCTYLVKADEDLNGTHDCDYRSELGYYKISQSQGWIASATRGT